MTKISPLFHFSCPSPFSPLRLAFFGAMSYNCVNRQTKRLKFHRYQTMSAEKRSGLCAGHTEGITLSGQKTADGWFSGDARRARGPKVQVRIAPEQSLRQKDRVFSDPSAQAAQAPSFAAGSLEKQFAGAQHLRLRSRFVLPVQKWMAIEKKQERKSTC